MKNKTNEKRNVTKKNKKGSALVDTSLCSDSGGILTLDLQNRNLTLYSLSYGAKCGCKSIKKLADS